MVLVMLVVLLTVLLSGGCVFDSDVVVVVVVVTDVAAVVYGIVYTGVGVVVDVVSISVVCCVSCVVLMLYRRCWGYSCSCW